MRYLCLINNDFQVLKRAKVLLTFRLENLNGEAEWIGVLDGRDVDVKVFGS